MSRRRRAVLFGNGIVLTLFAILTGCKPSPPAPPAGTLTPLPTGSGAGPGSNPPPGQPNHMSPEMQAQIEHYKSLGPGKK